MPNIDLETKTSSQSPELKRLLEQVEIYREKNKMTVKDISVKAGISPRYYQLLRAGEKHPHADTLIRLAASVELKMRLTTD